MEDMLLWIGAKLAAFIGSPASGVLGAAIALGVGLQAARDIASGKTQLERTDTTDLQNVSAHRNSVRKKIANVCRCQIGIGLLNLLLLIWLYVAATIKKEGTTLIPDVPQSVGFIALFCLSLAAIVLEFRRLRLSKKLEDLK